MISITGILAIATNTVREAVRSKLLYTLLFFAIALIGTGVLVSSLSYVERERIVQDVGMAAIRLFGVGIAIFVGVGLIHKEVERRTIYTILSKPISRSDFLLGKYLGLVMTVWLQLAIMAVSFVLVSVMTGAPVDAGHGKALLLTGFELMLVVAVATLFSSFTSPMLASMYSVGIYVVGHLTRDLHQLSQQADLESMRSFGSAVYHVLPDLEMFNRSIEAVHRIPIASADVLLPMAYSVAYSSVLLLLSVVLFQRRDFR